MQLNYSLLAIFIPTFFLVSITPGMCMTLSMTLGMTVGVRRTFWMMWGELTGVAMVTVAAATGVAAMMLNHPGVFTVFKYCGGLYLIYLGSKLWFAKGWMALEKTDEKKGDTRRAQLAIQGFVTAAANPKGWAFTIALLPPFIDSTQPLIPQLSVLLVVILLTEFFCLTLYATGGRTMRHFLSQGKNVLLMNRVAGVLMIGIGIWLALG